MAATGRTHWGSRLGFVLAAAGSAVGLGNVWKFPYITGTHGGGAFVLVYLACVLAFGVPILAAELVVGSASQRSPVGAFRALAGERTPWVGVGWLGVVAAYVILSYYAVVAGWACHYTWLALTGELTGRSPEALGALFGEVYADAGVNLGWHVAFMAVSVGVVIGGVQGGIERAARVLMPALLLMLVGLMLQATTLGGFGEGVDFVFGYRPAELTAEGVLEALGHSFFTLSLGMGAMITYGSYLKRDASVVGITLATSALDTAVALLACMVVFPITFTYGMEAAAGPGLVFQNVPLALAQLPGGRALAVVFFLLLVFAALTSAVALLEVATSTFIDELGWPRARAVLVNGAVITLLGVPSALSGSTWAFGEGFAAWFGRNWFDTFDYLATNWALPLGGLGVTLFAAWRLPDDLRQEGFTGARTTAAVYTAWLWCLRVVVPVGIGGVILHGLGVI